MNRHTITVSDAPIIRFLADGLKDPEANVKIMNNLDQLCKNKDINDRLTSQFEKEVQDIQPKITDSNNNNQNINNNIDYINNCPDEYSKFRLIGLRQLLK